MLQHSTTCVAVTGRRWDSNTAITVPVPVGQSLEDILLEAVRHLRKQGQYNRAYARSILRLCRCRVNGSEIARKQWPTTYPQQHDRIEFFQAPKGGGGGGGGKNVFGMILQAIVVIVAAAATFWAGGSGGWAAAGGWAAFGTYAGITAFTVGATMLIGALFPPAAPSLSLGSTGELLKDSQTYSITGARNGLNPYGFVPLVLGRHRVTPPLAAKNWTVWEGDIQYFHMCVLWGHPDVDISDFRIADTPLSNYRDVEHVFHQRTKGNDLKLFSKSYDERSVGAALKNASGPTTRVIGEAEDISCDIAFNGLCTINEKTGAYEWRSVGIEIKHRLIGTETWYGFGASYDLPAAQFSGLAWDYQPDKIWVNGSYDNSDEIYIPPHWEWPPREYYTTHFSATSNGIVASTSGWQGEALWSLRAGVLTNHRPAYVTGCEASYNASTNSVSITSGAVTGNPYFSFGNDSAKTIVRNVRKNNMPRGIYEVSMHRLTGDTSSTYVRDECSWQISRAIVNQQAFTSPIDVCVSELRIKATEQLSASVDEFNALAESVFPDWDGTAWTPRKTRNNASLARYLLTSRHSLNTPYTTQKLDDPTFVEFHQECADKGYTFDFVCDTEETTWKRLQQVVAAGRGAITLDNDGLYGIIMDVAGKEPVQLFTPRNSWGFSLNRTFTDLPHALRVSFINADDDFKKGEDFVYADGYDRSTATDIIEWDFPGVTQWETIWKFGRYHLAQMLHRPYTMSLSTDWEWRLCRRGQLVGVAHDVLMNVFGTARIQRLVYRVDDALVLVGKKEEIPHGEHDEHDQPLMPIGVQIDDTVVYAEPAPARYGIAVRTPVGKLITYEIIPEYDEEADILLFKYPLVAAQVPAFQALCSVSILGEEYEECLVASITQGENMSAELSLMPYAIDEILAADSGEIPPYNPPINLDVIANAKLKTPTIFDIKSDESVLIKQNGSTIICIAVWYTLAANTAENISVQMMATSSTQQLNGTTSNKDVVTVQNVVEGEVYTVTIRIVDRLGRTSPWSPPVRHKVIGRTTPPPAPSAVNLSGTIVSIEQENRPLDVVGHEVWMAYDAEDTFGHALQLSSPYTVNGLFDVAPWAGWARRIFVRTVDELGLSSEPVSVVINLGDVYVKNVLFTRSERALHWPETIENGYISGGTLYANENTSLWPNDDTAPFWPQDATMPLWPSGAGSILRYTWAVEVPMAYAGADISVIPQEFSGKLQAIEMRLYADPPLWPQDDAASLWPYTDNAPLWPQPIIGQWQTMPAKYTAVGGETLNFRVTYAQEIPAQIADISTVFDVQDKEWAVHNLAVLAGGTRVPVPAGYFRAITNTTFGLQYFEGSTATNVARIRNSETIGLDGYIVDGPIIMGLNNNNQSTSANTDILLKGY